MGCCDLHAAGSATGLQHINENEVKYFKHLPENQYYKSVSSCRLVSPVRNKCHRQKNVTKNTRKGESLLLSSF